jgi:hypothetical protein
LWKILCPLRAPKKAVVSKRFAGASGDFDALLKPLGVLSFAYFSGSW